MVKARNLIVDGGLTAYAAAKKTGITKSAIYMAPWYKAHMKELREKKKNEAC